MSSDFFNACAEARQKAAYMSGGELEKTICRLNTLARNAHERTLIANVEVVGGAATDDRRIFQSGLQRLRGATIPEVSEALEWFADLTILGSTIERRAMLMRVVASICPTDDPALNFIEDPGLADAREILSGRWSVPAQLAITLGRELRRWLAWAAIDAWLSWRRPEYLMVARHPSVKCGPDEEGSWEYPLLEAVVDLVQGSVNEACLRVRRITRAQRIPAWAPDRIARLATLYSPLAGHRYAEWEQALPAPAWTLNRAGDPAERAGAAFRIIVDKNKHADFMRVKDDIVATGWTTFAYFVSCRPGHVCNELGQVLLATVKRPEDASCWPWLGRVQEFATACEHLDDRRLALNLLAVALKAIPNDPVIAAACIRVIEACGPSELSAVVGDDLWHRLGDVTSNLSAPKQMMLERGGVWRAVIDGTNLIFGGKDRRAGGQASLRYLNEARYMLQKAGFEQIIMWFDASTRHYLTTSEAGELARLHATGKICIVSSGSADPKVIEAFLEAPEQTWVVTCDRYKQWEGTYPSLNQFWPAARLGFQIDHNNSLTWSRQLNTPVYPHA
ncbi:MAG: hypothetical protein DLM70_01380 [Chloroflexi bacterium]|nr:MAG: hypothetical protein DLM70_01380 [Chloroflexota bacterium]